MKYIVQAPDGSRHVIEGPDAASAAGDTDAVNSAQPDPNDPNPSTSIANKIGVAVSALPRGFLDSLYMLGQGAAAGSNTGNLNRSPANQEASDTALDASVLPKIANIGVPATPGNKPEQYLDAMGQAVGGLPLAGPLGPETSGSRAVITALMGGAGGQAASDATGGNPLARVIGALAGGSLPMAEKAALHPNNLQTILAKATGNIPDADFEFGQAAANQTSAAQQGIPQTTAQAFENAPGIQQVQNALVASGKAPKTTAMLQQQVGTALGKANDATNALPGAVKAPIDVANQTQAAATDAVKAAQQQAGDAFRQTIQDQGGTINLSDQQVAPFARWLKTLVQSNPNSGISALGQDVLDSIQNPAAAVPKATKGAPPAILGANGQPLAAQVAQSAPTYISDPLALKQAVDYSLSGAGPRLLNSKFPADTRAAAQIRTQFNTMLDKSAPQVAAANAAYEDVMKNVVNPLKEGPVGQVAGRQGAVEGVPAPAKISAILDQGTVPGAQVSPILTLAREMNKQDPTAFATAVKSGLATKLAKATTTTGGQVDPSALADFYNSTYGNAAQKQGLKEQLVGVAQGQGMSSNALYPGFLKIMDTVGRLVNRPSNTAGVSASQVSEMAGSNAVSNLFKLITFKRGQAGAVESGYANNTYAALDDLMTSPDGVKTLRTLAQNDPMGKVGQQAIISYLAGSPKAQNGNQQDQK